MSNVLELLSGRVLSADLREGAKFFAVSGNGALKASGSRSGSVALWSDGSSDVHYMNVQPLKRKNKCESEVQAMWLSETGDMLYAATSIDIVAINTTARTVAWDYQQKRQWGFLSSIPQGGYLSGDDDLTTYYSSGEVVKLDRKARVLESATHNYTARMVESAGDWVFGSDGHWIWKWSKERGFGHREEIAHKACYFLAASGDGSTLAIRSANRVSIYDTAAGAIVDEIACEPGLPQMVVNFDGSVIGMLNEGRVRFLNRSGDVFATYEVEDEFPISIHRSHDGIVVGMRSGRIHELILPS
jgi:hypothetical protein